MTTKFIAAGNKELTDLDALVDTLESCREVKVFVDGVQVTKLRFSNSKKEGFSSKFDAQIHLHGVPARNLDHVISYVEGDAHDRSKVQFLSPAKGFKNFF